MKISKNRKQMLNNFDTTKVYEPLEAIKILKEKSYVKFKAVSYTHLTLPTMRTV